MVAWKRNPVFSKEEGGKMTLKKVSAKEWRKMGLPSSTWTISFGSTSVQKPSFVLGPVKKHSSVPDYKLPKKKK